MEKLRLYNKYGSDSESEHARVIDKIVEGSMDEITAYLKVHNICPRDAMNSCIMVIVNRMAEYTIREALALKKQERRETSKEQCCCEYTNHCPVHGSSRTYSSENRYINQP